MSEPTKKKNLLNNSQDLIMMKLGKEQERHSVIINDDSAIVVVIGDDDVVSMVGFRFDVLLHLVWFRGDFEIFQRFFFGFALAFRACDAVAGFWYVAVGVAVRYAGSGSRLGFTRDVVEVWWELDGFGVGGESFF